MTVHPPSSPGSRRSAQGARLLAFACAVIVLFGVSRAYASAPMCDEHAQTIAAPPPVMPPSEGKISRLTRCGDELNDRLELLPGPSEQKPTPAFETSERVLPVLAGSLPKPRGRVQPVELDLPVRAGPGFGSGVYRPPRAST